jgi:hypothetical protein
MNGADGSESATRMVAKSGARDGMTSVRLRHLDLGKALNTVAGIGSVASWKLKAAQPSKATEELRLGFAVAAGKLTALQVGGGRGVVGDDAGTGAAPGDGWGGDG